MLARRPWYTSLLLLPKTVFRMFSTLRNHRMGWFIPVVGILLMGSMILWFVNTIAPLAPFVYSLF